MNCIICGKQQDHFYGRVGDFGICSRKCNDAWENLDWEQRVKLLNGTLGSKDKETITLPILML